MGEFVAFSRSEKRDEADDFLRNGAEKGYPFHADRRDLRHKVTL